MQCKSSAIMLICKDTVGWGLRFWFSLCCAIGFTDNVWKKKKKKGKISHWFSVFV